MSSARILILTGSHLCRNPRVVKEATTLATAGHDVTVLGIRSHRPSVPLDTELVTAVGLFRHHQIECLDGPIAWLHRARTRLAREMLRRSGIEAPSVLGPAPALLRAARRIPVDLVIAHTEPALWAATRLLTSGKRIAADLEDWHSEDLLPEARATRPLRLLRKIEQALLHHAAYITTTSHALAGALHARNGGRFPTVITNSFPLGPSLMPSQGSTPVRLLWFSQTIGPGRGLEAFLAAWALTHAPSRLTLVGEDHQNFGRSLRDALPPTHRNRLDILPSTPPDALPALIAEHHIGLALENRAPPNKDLTISNKILQYLGAGLAVVATPTAGQREVLARNPAAGLILETPDDPSAVARALDALLADPDAVNAKRRAARELAKTHYCWEREAPRLLSLVEHTLA